MVQEQFPLDSKLSICFRPGIDGELFNGNCDADLRIIGIVPELKGASGALKSIPTP